MSTHRTLLVHVVGARPNIIKLGPLYRRVDGAGWRQTIVHTGQHFDDAMSAQLFEDFGLKQPEVNFNLGRLRPAQQFGEIVTRLGEYFDRHQPLAVMTYGDVRSTAAAAIAAYYSGVRSIHYEAGQRAFHRALPEELNRITADVFSDILLLAEQDAEANLARLGMDDLIVHTVGSLMCDAAKYVIEHSTPTMKMPTTPYVVVTAHRQEHVDDTENLRKIVDIVSGLATRIDVHFPVHPRTEHQLEHHGLISILRANSRVHLHGPLRYRDMIWLLKGASAIASDSGGIVAESVYLRVPHIYLRERCEHRIALDTNGLFLAGLSRERVMELLDRVLASPPTINCPTLWDGNASERIQEVLARTLTP